MNHAERLKESMLAYFSVMKEYTTTNNLTYGQLKYAHGQVHDAIDAMQSALDESERQKEVWIKQCWVRDEEISGLSRLLDDAEAKLVERDAELEKFKKLPDAMNRAWHAIGADFAGLKWADFVAALSEEVKGGE